MTVVNPAQREIEAGLQALGIGQFESALSCFQRALRLHPDNPDTLNLLAVVQQHLGRPEQALDNLRRAARLRRNDPAILANLGQVCAELNQPAEAEAAFRAAIRIDPRQLDPQMGLASALAQQGQFKAAETLFERLTQRHPDQPALWFNHGNVLRDQNRMSDALDSFHRALTLDANHLDARNNLAGALHALQRFDEAEREYRACLAVDSQYFPARISLASLLIDVARDSEAERLCQGMLHDEPHRIKAWLMLARAQNHQGRIRQQLNTMHAVVMQAPQHVEVLNACAGALFNAGQFAEAMRMLDQSQAIAPDLHKKQNILGSVLLSHGYLEAGWLCYRQRPGADIFCSNNPQTDLAAALPDDLSEKHVFVQREQGLGDELFFLRYAPLLARRGARISYQASAKIHTLLERVPYLDAVLPEHAPPPAADYRLLAGDLPYFTMATVDVAQEQLAAVCTLTPGEPVGMLTSDHHDNQLRYPPSLAIAPLPGRIEEMRQRLAAAGPGPYMGLTWRAGVPPREQGGGDWTLYKATVIADLAKAISVFPGTLLVLQRGPVPGEIATVAQTAGRPLQDFSDLNDDLEGMLALLALIEEYIGVSNTNMHLRAAVGKTARVLVPAPAEWRWMQSGEASPWFPGYSLYRQDNDGVWSTAWTALARDLAHKWQSSIRT